MEEKKVRAYTGTKKQAPVNMRKEEVQFVIDGYTIDEVLSQIPAGLTIIQAYAKCTTNMSTRKIIIPNALRKLGVSYMQSRSESRQCAIQFDQTSKDAIKKKVTEICKIGNYERARAYFQYVVIANAEGTVKFEHCTKEIKPDETDLRKKLRVLGATTGSGRVQSVIADLNAKKYKCTIKEEPVRLVMCSKA